MGYRACCVDGAPKANLTCSHCGNLLRSPVQTDDGLRLCKKCFDTIITLPGHACQECQITLASDQYYPDRAVEREVQALQVWCEFKPLGCNWQGRLQLWEAHLEECTHKGVECPHSGCGQLVSQSALLEHVKACPYRLVKCGQCNQEYPLIKEQVHDEECMEKIITCSVAGCTREFPRKKLAEHERCECILEKCLTCGIQVERSTGREWSTTVCHGNSLETQQPSERAESPSNTPEISIVRSSLVERPVHLMGPLQNFRHHQLLAGQVQDLVGVVRDVGEGMREELVTVSEDMEKMKQETTQLRAEVDSVKCDLSNTKAGSGRGLKEGGEQDLEVLRSQVASLEQNEVKRKEMLRRVQVEVEEVKKDLVSARSTGGFRSSGGAFESSSTQQHRLMEEMQRQMASLKVQLSELELQFQASLASTFTGTFLWRIPEVTRRRRDAVDGRVTSIYSPPFYTGRNGYKMCIRAYLNGDGMGYQSHLSLFFVIMRGESDPLLKWPFEYKVSMILVDQTHRKHVVQTFKPTPESNSFQRPKTDMNVASGCPQFSKLNTLDNPCYVRDDVMYIKCIVDTTKIFHP